MLFADILLSEALSQFEGAASPAVDPFALMDYGAEASLKERCIALFWKKHRLQGTIEPLVRAPKPRFYRATSKRRVELAKNKVSFLFASETARPGHLAESNLEPEHHGEIFAFVHGMLGNPAYSALAKALNHVIIRGVSPCVLIFNVSAIDGQIVRKLKAASDKIRDAFGCVQGCYAYVDPTRSEYYLEARRPSRKEVGYKKLFGSDQLLVAVCGRPIRYTATSFSQVNEPMLPLLVGKVAELLQPGADLRLLDLYCGYGLFSLALADQVAEVVGIDLAGSAIEAAKENARRLGFGNRAFFIAGRISAALLWKTIRQPGDRPEIAILDPPKQGTEDGIIQALAARKPLRIVHIFCGADRLSPELAAWAKNEYQVVRAIPFDLFPGSANLEIVVLLEPQH